MLSSDGTSPVLKSENVTEWLVGGDLDFGQVHEAFARILGAEQFGRRVLRFGSTLSDGCLLLSHAQNFWRNGPLKDEETLAPGPVAPLPSGACWSRSSVYGVQRGRWS